MARIWGDVTIGGDDLTAAQLMSKLDITISDWHPHVLHLQTFFAKSNEERTLKLVSISIDDLGLNKRRCASFHHRALNYEIWGRAEDYGLNLCHPEVVPCLYARHTNDRKLRPGPVDHEDLTVVVEGPQYLSEYKEDATGIPLVFGLGFGMNSIFLSGYGLVHRQYLFEYPRTPKQLKKFERLIQPG